MFALSHGKAKDRAGVVGKTFVHVRAMHIVVYPGLYLDVKPNGLERWHRCALSAIGH